MRFSGFVKTENVKEYCGLWMRVDNRAEDVLQFDNMNDRRIMGSTHWNHYAIVLDVPEESATISIGVLLMGQARCGWTASVLKRWILAYRRRTSIFTMSAGGAYQFIV